MDQHPDHGILCFACLPQVIFLRLRAGNFSPNIKPRMRNFFMRQGRFSNVEEPMRNPKQHIVAIFFRSAGKIIVKRLILRRSKAGSRHQFADFLRQGRLEKASRMACDTLPERSEIRQVPAPSVEINNGEVTCIRSFHKRCMLRFVHTHCHWRKAFAADLIRKFRLEAPECALKVKGSVIRINQA